MSRHGVSDRRIARRIGSAEWPSDHISSVISIGMAKMSAPPLARAIPETRVLSGHFIGNPMLFLAGRGNRGLSTHQGCEGVCAALTPRHDGRRGGTVPTGNRWAQKGRRRIMDDSTKYLLDEKRLPKTWYNIVGDLPVSPPPLLNPESRRPVTV